MKKSELNKLKAIRKKLDKYANEINAMANIVAKYDYDLKSDKLRWSGFDMDRAVAELCNAQNELIDFIRTEQPDYLETNYNL